MMARQISFTINITRSYASRQYHRLNSPSKPITKRLLITVALLLLSLSSTYHLAYVQADTNGSFTPLVSKSAALNNEIWFEDIKASISVSNQEMKILTQFVTDSILHSEYDENSLSDSLKRDNLPRIVFVSLSNGISPASVVPGSGNGLVEAIKSAVSTAQALLKERQKPKWIKLDIVNNVFAMDNINLDDPIKYDRSLHGLAFNKQYGIAFLPEEVLSNTLINKRQKIRMGKITKYLNRRSIHTNQKEKLKSQEINTLYCFTTTSCFYENNVIVNLYRGHQLYSQISKEELLSAASHAGDYLIRSVGLSGKFAYSYFPKKNSVSEDYNIIRHAGTVYAMLELYDVTHDPELFKAAYRAMEYLLLSIKPYSADGDEMLCVVENGYVKLGGNALASIALAKYTEITKDRKYISTLRKLGRWIQKAQNESGKFHIQKQKYSGGKVYKLESEYYPGEAILAMTRIYAVDPDEEWLDVAEKAAKYLINIRDHGLSLSEMTHDHWLLYALNGLYRYRPDQLHMDHTLKITHSILQAQNFEPTQPDWKGSFYSPPRSTPTATRTEGLCSAYFLTQDFGDSKEAEPIIKAIRHAVAFQLQTQFMPESVMYLNLPQSALWGFHRSLTNYEIRIDYVQHNISSLLGYYRILNNQEQED